MLTIAIVFGGESCEHDVSVITALSAYRVAREKYQVYLVYYKEGSFWTGDRLKDVSFYKSFDRRKVTECRFWQNRLLIKSRFTEKKKEVDCVLNACHGGCGEDGALSGYFETVGTPYVGSGVFGSSLFMDKVFSKMLFEKWRIPTVPYRYYRKNKEINPDEIVYPVIVKPARLGSSVGIGVAKDKSELSEKTTDAFLYDDKILLEKCLTDYREFNCAVVMHGEEVIVSEVEEPMFEKDYLDFFDKYTESGKAERRLPADIDEKLRDKIRETAKAIYKKADLSGVARVDFLYDGKKLYVNEVNTIPGGLSLYLFLPLGVKAGEVLSWMVDSAIRDYKEKKKFKHDFSSTVLEHYKPTMQGGKGIKA